ncbi:hypothetical protein M408DRAFT_72322 [Serendipita vermifera MAFF 305830]|uniref:NACHT domain-containing protein n=1 Tax=Serendipita vermifera MAFF 305830 TaxID=933852 RepID=A0A0C3B5F6_SERVB|nr:hypothetical protein M408DRAFT_72322 [Serendipita vermifera MAFF 305830]
MFLPTFNHLCGQEFDGITQDKIVARLKPLGVDVNCPLGECMEGTREDILGAILNWVIDSSAANIFWLKGHPGVGKSAIAASLIEKLQSTRHLGSSFFFQRERFNVMTTSALWRTVACDLARRYPAVRKHLIAALEADKTLPITAKVDKLFRELIHKPLMAWEEAGEEVVSVIIVDALDECGGLDGQHSNHRINLIRTLKSWSILPKRFKLVVTSRAEPDILDLFSSTQHEPLEIPSGNVVNESSSKDIERFLEHQIGQIAARSHGALAPDWPGRQIIKELTQIAAGLFIWVETALRFLRRGEPQEQLNRILDGASMGGLASLYSSILQASFEEPSETTLESFHRVVGAIILAEEPLPASSLIQLCSVDPSTLSYIRNGLQSVMDPGEELMFSHESFVDFLFNPEECRSGFSIDVLQQSRHLTLRCFQVMKQNLRFNICDLKSSYESNDEIVDLEKRIEECITPSLIYSSSYWADHLAETNFDLEISRDIENFMQNQFLFWLEVLSLTQRVSFGTGMMAGLIEWLRIGGQDETMARDMKKFIARFGSLISQSVPHIYLSALPFAPRSSMVYMQYIKDYPQTIRIERGGQEDWPAIQNVLVENEFSVTLMGFTPDGACIIFHLDDGIIQMWDAETGEIVAEPFEANTESVSSVSFSPDGARIAFGSYDGTLRVWDAETQDMVAGPFEGHTSEIGSLTFSPDGMRIVSSSIDGEFRVWDAQSAEMITGPFKGHAESLTDVAFSPDGVFVASNSDSSDINFWVWDVATAQMVAGPFEGHTDVVNSVAFSPDGTHIVSGSSDKKVCVWDAKTAEMVIGSLQGHTDGVNSVAFSPDGTRVVSGSEDRTIRVWNAESGKMVAGPFKGHYQGVTSVSFSPDGTRIVSGSNDGTIRVWDAETIEIGADPFEGHKNRVNSVAFSPDGTRVVSGSEDGELWVWDAQSAERIAGPFEGDRNWASTVAFSSDGTHVTSGACLFDMAIRIWDVETAKMVGAGPFKKHTGFVGSVAFSPNGTYIVSGSHDGTVRVWNAETAQMVAGPLQGHTNQVKSVAFSPNGACVASGSYDRTLRVWDAKSGEMVAGPFEGHTHYVTSVAFSPDSIRVASGSWDKTIRVWDATTSRMVVGPLVGHTDRVSSVIFSPDGAYIASGSYDKTLRLWDAETAQMIAGPFEGHADCVASVAFSPDGTRIVSGSHDRTIRLWDAKNAQMIAHTSTGDTRWMVDGWILGPQSELLFWVPPSIRNGLFWPSTIFVIGERLVTKLNLEHFAHGEAWTHCRDPLPERGVDGLTVMTQAPTAGNAKRKVPLDGHEEERTSDASANKRSKVSRGSDSAKEP